MNRFLVFGGAEQIRRLLKRIGLKLELYGLHSMRSGGASLAAALGLPDRLIMCHGGWRSESSKKCVHHRD